MSQRRMRRTRFYGGASNSGSRRAKSLGTSSISIYKRSRTSVTGPMGLALAIGAAGASLIVGIPLLLSMGIPFPWPDTAILIIMGGLLSIAGAIGFLCALVRTSP